MEFKTTLSKMNGDDLIIRGKSHSRMVGNWSFSKTIFFLLQGREPGEKEEFLFDAILTLIIDHGMGTASSMAARFVSSAGNPLNAALAGGVLALGSKHGGAIKNAMTLFVKAGNSDVKSFVATALQKKQLLPGFGHKVYKERDPRSKKLRELVIKLGYDAPTLKFAFAVEKEIEKQKGKKVVLNVDGAIGALLADMGFSPEAGGAVFLIGRAPGLAAQALEEQASGILRRVSEEEIIYEGSLPGMTEDETQ